MAMRIVQGDEARPRQSGPRVCDRGCHFYHSVGGIDDLCRLFPSEDPAPSWCYDTALIGGPCRHGLTEESLQAAWGGERGDELRSEDS